VSDWQAIALIAAFLVYLGLPSMRGVASALRDIANALEKIATAIREQKP